MYWLLSIIPFSASSLNIASNFFLISFLFDSSLILLFNMGIHATYGFPLRNMYNSQVPSCLVLIEFNLVMICSNQKSYSGFGGNLMFSTVNDVLKNIGSVVYNGGVEVEFALKLFVNDGVKEEDNDNEDDKEGRYEDEKIEHLGRK
ncbi:MAG: hypothetical protein EZS28_014625 [Streblomastix strix]|uniref:Uncharacterized protein n=1 Tax=Streblomastix strix TaxID=222440 RepID=A0A5J4W4Q7_9EUKA|nr:MAG: hypothetical protein EZS28_014625 [Streblomastix strix]